VKNLLFTALILVAIFAPGASFAQAAARPAAPDAPTMTAERQELFGRWVEIKKRIDSKDFDGAKSGLKELDGRCLDMGITSLEPLSAAMLKQGRTLLDAKEVGGAMILIEAASRLSPNYPPPYYAKGWAYLAQDRMKALMTLDAFLEGFRRSVNDFWWSFFYAGNKFTSLLFTLASLFSLFGLFMALRYTPLLAHDLSETLMKREQENLLKYAVLPGVLLAILITLGYWWSVSAAFLSLWVYFNKKEKLVATLFFVLLIFMPEIMSNFANFAQAGGNKLLWVMDGANKGRNEEGAEQYLKYVLGNEPDNEQALVSLAMMYKKEKRYREAEGIYLRLVELRPDRAIYQNNLGNIHFLTGRLDDAIRDYNAAIQDEPGRVLSYFNLSQVYGEHLMFSEREKTDLVARELAPATVAALRDKAGSVPNRMVFDEPIPVGSFWSIAFSGKPPATDLAESMWTMTMRFLPINGTRLAGISFIVLALGLNAIRRKGVRSHFCKKCGRVSCRKCQKPYYSKELCPQCHQIFVKLDGVEARDRVRKMLETREIHRKEGILFRISSLLLPGAGQFMTGRPLSGFIFMGVFIFLVRDIFFGRFFEVPYDFGLPFIKPDILIMSAILVLFYVLAQVDTNRITK
jgi:tetratricopeptide (TPR) repeat protein